MNTKNAIKMYLLFFMVGFIKMAIIFSTIGGIIFVMSNSYLLNIFVKIISIILLIAVFIMVGKDHLIK